MKMKQTILTFLFIAFSMISDEKATEALSLTHFEFDKEQIYSNKVYRDLCELDATLYQQLKDYRAEHMTYST